ncbi:ABC transporter ATP-binding protein [Frigidibacter sp. SD6-1]|uniref:ABC transporter ATP-binding protein n=1 Tax=Frigidibacter sp. SD6-1 TaxID=3032581 RepID=UPI0024DFF912|nr:ABC transporter ATP-binding protein [Frigidibacter sp. SD6-1]
MSALLSIRDLSVDFALGSWLDIGARRQLNILSGISLDLVPGETLGLVGESGSGKTTLARAILGLQKLSGGTIQFEGAPLASPSDFARVRRRTAMMFQDAVSSLSPRMAVGEAVTEPFAIHREALADRRQTARDLLAEVGLRPEIASRFPHELSGGQARRVGVARALALRPALVIADEPTAGLDVSVQAEILNLMADLKDRLSLSYLIITHNLALVRHVADRIAVLYLGRLVETGPSEKIFARPAHPYTRSLIAAEPIPDPRRRRADLAIKGEIPSILRRPGGCVFHTRCPIAKDRCKTETPAPRREGAHQVNCHFADI